MNLIEILQDHAEKRTTTTYFLRGRMIYPDEIFAANGFLPLIGRMAERRVARALGNKEMRCGFSYAPYRDSIFKERMDIAPVGDGIYANSLRLNALVEAALDVVGLGLDMTLDLTPVFSFFNTMPMQERSALRHKEDLVWPLYLPMQVSCAAR